MDKNLLDGVFHAYDIRGEVTSQLDENFFEVLGKAYVTFLKAKKIVVGNDIRPESVSFKEAFIKGALSLGVDVVDIGEVATEMIYFASGSNLEYDGGAVVTASHNPSGWNGCKMVGKGAIPLSGDYGLKEIKELMIQNNFTNSDKAGTLTKIDIYPDFKEKVLSILEGVEIKKLKVVVDAGNGIGGKMFDYIFGEMPFEVTKMYFEPDGTFPNHVPNPLEEENVIEIKAKTKELNADIGIAIDGDADRVFFIDSKGRNPDGAYTGSILARKILEKNPGEVILQDPKLIWAIAKEVIKVGGKPIQIKTGHSFFKAAMREHNAIFGVELSSHIYFRDFYSADSGMMAIAYMIKFLSEGLDFIKELDYLYSTYPTSGEVNYKVNNNAEIIKTIEEKFKDAKISKIDGISIEYPEWRFNLRGSNTQPLLRLCMEAESKDLIVEHFKEVEKLIGGTRDNKPQLAELQ